jgi:Do/DeqQ family serine protease
VEVVKKLILVIIVLAVGFLGLKYSGINVQDYFKKFSPKKDEVVLDIKPQSNAIIKPSEQILSVQESFEKVAEATLPSVVNIYTEQRVRVNPGFDSPFGDNPLFREFFRDFFGAPKKKEYKSTSLGSGFVITEDGYIVTNDHVIKNADSISVKMSDKKTYKAKIVGSDPKTDIAVIKIDAKNLKPLKFGNSDALKIGQWAIAVGNPFGLNGTLTVGVISAKGRSGLGIETYEDFIQTDASINPGNSGGPLLNIYGEVIGINTAIVASGQGIGFAIPATMAKPIIEQIINKGKVDRSWIGVGIQDLTPELAKSMGVKVDHGVVVNKIYPNSPAQKYGLKEGDIIIKCNNESISSASDLQKVVISSKVGSEIRLTVIRDGKEIILKVITEKMPDDDTSTKGSLQELKDERLGVTVRNLSQEDLENFNHKNGVIVVDVKNGSLAEIVGLAEGDLIISINKRPIRNVKEYSSVLKSFAKGAIINLMVEREGDTFYIAVRLN